MANEKDRVKDSGANQKAQPATTRIENEAALREEFEAARLRVKRLARKETENRPTDEEVLHFRLKGGE